MKIGQFNKNNSPKVVIIVPETLLGAGSKIIQRYLMPLGVYKKDVQIIGVPVPKKGVIKKADFDEEWYHINNYCETMGVTDIMVTIPAYMKMITGTKKAYKFEVAQGTHETVGEYRVYPLLNLQILNFQPDKLKLIQRSLNHLVDILSGNVSDVNEALVLDNNLIYTKPSQAAKALEQLLEFDKLTCDIETTGLRFESDSILTISFSWSKKSAVCFAVHEQYDCLDSSNTIKRLLKDFFNEFYAKGGVLIGHNFASFDLPFVVHDIMRGRDFTDTHYKYINNFNICDTLIMAYLTTNSTDRVPRGLKEIAYPVMGNYDNDIDQSKLIEYPLEQVATYNNYDVIANWYVYDRLLEDMEQHWCLFNRYTPVLKTMAKIKMNGFSVTPDKVEEAHIKLDTLIEEINNKLLEYPSVRGTILNLNEIAMNKYNSTHKKQKTLDEFDEVFKAGSTNHKTILFKDMLGVEVFKKSRLTNAPSYDKEVLGLISDIDYNDEAKDIALLLLELNAARIVDGNFLKNMAKYAFEIAPNDFRIFTNFNMSGTISGRISSSGTVNFLNLPANSTYGKLIKSCFEAPEGYVFAGGDLNNLEGRSLANVSKDESKLKIITEGFDEHSLACATYFQEELEDRDIFIDKTNRESVNTIKKVADDLRSAGKPVSFGMSYLSTQHNIKKVLKCSDEKAQSIYDKYWDMFKGVRAYYDKYIKFAEENGYVISEFSGLWLRTPNILAGDVGARESEIRTLCNFLIQSSSFMLLEYLADYQDFIEENGLEEDVVIVNSVYDSVYKYVKEDNDLIKSLNKHFVEIMSKDLFEGQLVPMVMDLDIGRAWDDQTTLSVETSLDEISGILNN